MTFGTNPHFSSSKKCNTKNTKEAEKMKKLLSLLLAALLLTAVGCNTTPSELPDAPDIQESVTEAPQTDGTSEAPDGYESFTKDIYLCDDVYRTDDTPTYGTGTLSLSLADPIELCCFDILLCGDGCNQTSVISRAFWGYAPSWRLEKYDEYGIWEGWSFNTRKYSLEVPEDIKSDMIAQGAPESVTDPRDHIYLLSLDEKHYAFIHLKGKDDTERPENEEEIANGIVKTAKIEFTPSGASRLYNKVTEYLEDEFHRVYDPYYDIKSLTVSNWNEQGNEATFYYTMVHSFYNRDPDTVDYIKKAKENNSPGYQRLYDDYLADKKANYEFKAILTENGIALYSNVSPKDVNWQPVKIDDYILGNG